MVFFGQVTAGNLIDHVTLVIRKRRHHSFHPCGKDSRRCSIPPWLARTGNHLKWYYTGLLITAIVTFIAKSVAGQLRPNFIDVCQPHLLFKELNCTDKLGYSRYVTEYVCTGDLFSAFSARYCKHVEYYIRYNIVKLNICSVFTARHCELHS